MTSALTAIERRWLAEDPHDPRPNCANREQHAVVLYGERWTEPTMYGSNWPQIDGKGIARSHRQIRCEGCNRWTIWVPK